MSTEDEQDLQAWFEDAAAAAISKMVDRQDRFGEVHMRRAFTIASSTCVAYSLTDPDYKIRPCELTLEDIGLRRIRFDVMPRTFTIDFTLHQDGSVTQRSSARSGDADEDGAEDGPADAET